MTILPPRYGFPAEPLAKSTCELLLPCSQSSHSFAPFTVFAVFALHVHNFNTRCYSAVRAVGGVDAVRAVGSAVRSVCAVHGVDTARAVCGFRVLFTMLTMFALLA